MLYKSRILLVTTLAFLSNGIFCADNTVKIDPKKVTALSACVAQKRVNIVADREEMLLVEVRSIRDRNEHRLHCVEGHVNLLNFIKERGPLKSLESSSDGWKVGMFRGYITNEQSADECAECLVRIEGERSSVLTYIDDKLRGEITLTNNALWCSIHLKEAFSRLKKYGREDSIMPCAQAVLKREHNSASSFNINEISMNEIIKSLGATLDRSAFEEGGKNRSIYIPIDTTKAVKTE